MKNLFTAYFEVAMGSKSINYLIASIALLFISLQAQAQVGIGTITPDASAQLDVSSTSKGVLIPRMNKAERDLIPTPATGLLIFQTNETPGFYYYNGTGWAPLIPEKSSTIIPFSSGTPISFNPLFDGRGAVGIIGFGASTTATVSNNSIDLTGNLGLLLNFAFSAPRSGIIESISASFSNLKAFQLFGPMLDVTAQVFISSGNNNVFTPLNGAIVKLSPNISGTVTFGSVRSGIATGLNIPVNAQDRLLLVFYETTGGVINLTLTGYASAGISIK